VGKYKYRLDDTRANEFKNEINVYERSQARLTAALNIATFDIILMATKIGGVRK
jgi:hypothetical protein